MIKMFFEFICLMILCVMLYYSLWIGCALNDTCYYANMAGVQ